MPNACVGRAVCRYGEAEQRLAGVFDACAELGSAVVFLDEIDALATARDGGGGMHEATRRSLSVLLRKLDGFETNKSTVRAMQISFSAAMPSFAK
jgi:ATP-dependent 26S proteasome regulatory subunit